jgi:hypothetical protein
MKQALMFAGLKPARVGCGSLSEDPHFRPQKYRFQVSASKLARERYNMVREASFGYCGKDEWAQTFP